MMPFNVDSLFKQGKLLYHQEKYEEALRCLNDAIDQSPGNPDCYYYKAETLRKYGMRRKNKKE